MSELSLDSITFGKYKNKNLDELLKDRSYCNWLIEQKWFKEQYEYLYNRVKQYKPSSFFFKEIEFVDFLQDYRYFNLIKIENLEIKLLEQERKDLSK